MAGTGLLLAGTTFSVDFTAVQRRVTATCPPGQSIRAIDAAGAVTCEVDDTGGGSTYFAGSGLTLTGTTFSVAPGGVTSAMHAYGVPTRVPFFPTALSTTCGAGTIGGNVFGSTTSVTAQYIGALFYDESTGFDTGLDHDFTRGRLRAECRGDGVLEIVDNCTTVVATIICRSGIRPWTAVSAEFSLPAAAAYNLRVRSTTGVLMEWANPAILAY
jgi:hypothetical protein